MDAVAAVERHERVVVALALLAVVAAGWAWLVPMHMVPDAIPASPMRAGMDMPGWGVATWLVTLAMWTVMMSAMMLPGAVPIVLAVLRVQRERAGGATKRRAALFLAGYLAVWTLFGVLATAAQFGLARLGELSMTMATVSGRLDGILLIAAGAFQFTPLKHACLARCRSPLGFVLTEWRNGDAGAFVMGWRHGLFCVGCCWALMVLLFVFGVMNMVAVAMLTAFVLAEKLLPQGKRLAHLAGILLVAGGAWLLVA